MNEKYYCNIDDNLLDSCVYFQKHHLSNIPRVFFEDEKYIPLREYALFHMGFSVVSLDNCYILKRIIGSGKVLEIMCGLGAYSYALRKLGCNVIATDDMSWMMDDSCKFIDWKMNAWIDDIESIDAISAIKKYGKEVDYILMCWPPQNNKIAVNALLTMRSVNPRCRMIYIGEGKGGCTADDAFFDALIDISEEYELITPLRDTYRNWGNDLYYDKQFIVR